MCSSKPPRRQCYSCGGFGHFSKDCRQGQKCYKCGEMGHVSKDCVHADQDKVCYVCKLPGHVASQCEHKEKSEESEIVGDVAAPIVSSTPIKIEAES